MSSAARPVVSSFRVLLRVVNETFAGDLKAIQTCRREAFKQYRANAGERDAARIQKMVADALDAAQFLRESVVQAKLNEQGNYAMRVKSQGPGNLAVQPAGGAEESASGGGGGCGKGGCGCS